MVRRTFAFMESLLLLLKISSDIFIHLREITFNVIYNQELKDFALLHAGGG